MPTTRRLTFDRLNDAGCERLLCALLQQMSVDFKTAYMNFIDDPDDQYIAQRYRRVRNEFLSDYFTMLTRLNGEAIVEKLEKIVRDEHRSAKLGGVAERSIAAVLKTDEQ